MQGSFYGLLDFTGIPVGVFPTLAPSTTGRGFKGAGKKSSLWARYTVLAMAQEQTLLRAQQLRFAEAAREAVAYNQFRSDLQAAQKHMTEAAIYSVVLGEI